MSGSLDLTTLMTSMGRQLFLAEHWGRRCAAVDGPVDRFGELAQLPERWAPETLALHARGPLTVCYPPHWLGGTVLASESAVDFPAQESEWMHELGAALYVSDFARLEPAIQLALASLRRAAQSVAGVGCDLLITGEGAPAHVPLPTSSMFLIQLRGHQEWSADGSEVTALAPGSVFYVPDGRATLVRSEDEAFTLIVTAPAPYELSSSLSALSALMIQSEALRAPALVSPAPGGLQRARAQAADAIANLPTMLESLSLDGRESLDDRDLYVRCPATQAELRATPGPANASELVVVSREQGNTSLTLDGPVACACAWALDQSTPFNATDARWATGLEIPTLAALLEALTDSGALQRVRQ